MTEIFKQFKAKVIESLGSVQEDDNEINNLVALGVLLWAVAEADEKFLPEEKDKIGDTIQKYDNISDEDLPIVLRAIEEASIERIDFYSFAKEASKDLDRDGKIEIVENLFRIGCIDLDLDEKEHETIRKISGLLGLDHKEFVDSKVKVKKEFGMDTAGL